MADLEVAFPDAERATVAYLAPLLDDHAIVGTRNPAGTDDFVRVRSVGGVNRSRVVDEPVLDVLVWATDDQTRMDLARLARTHLHRASGTRAGDTYLGACRDVMLPRRMPDPANNNAEVVIFTVALAMQLATTNPDEE